MTQATAPTTDTLFDAHRGDLKSSSAKGGLVSVVSQAGIFVLGLGSMMYLGRVLEVDDFGLAAMAYSVLLPVLEIRDAGMPAAMIQQKNLTRGQGTAMFWRNFKSQIIVSLAVALGAWPVAQFYGDDRLTIILLLFAFTIFFSGLTVLHRGLLRRQMRFGAVAKIELGAEFAGVAVACASAAMGAGYWALIYLQIASQLYRASAYWLSAGWVPGRPGSASGHDIQSMRSYSRNVTGTKLIEQLVGKLDQILIGYFATQTALGLYNRAFKWSVMPVKQLLTPLQQVMVSGSSKLVDKPEKFRNFFRHGLTMTHAIVIPVMLWLFVAAGDFIRILLGPKWDDAVPIFRVLVFGGLMGTTVLITRWLYLAEGRTKEQLRWSVVSMPVLALGVVGGVIAGRYWDALGVSLGVAWGFAITTALLAVPRVAYAMRGSILRQRDYWLSAWRPMVASLLAAGPALWVQDGPMAQSLYYIRTPVILALFSVIYFALFFLMPGGVKETRTILDNLRSVRGK